MRASLGLAGGLDDVDLVRDVERSFDIQFPDEVWNSETVGDLFALVMAQLPDRGSEPGRCASAMCFYRLRRMVLTLAPHLELRPSTPITVLRSVSVKRLYRTIQAGGLRPPVPYVSAWGGCSLLLAVAAPVGPFLLRTSWWTAVLWMLAFAALFRLSPRRLPPDVKTCGGLVELLTVGNIGRLASHGARLGRAEAWKALQTVCISHVGDDGGEIGMGTLLLQPRNAAS